MAQFSGKVWVLGDDIDTDIIIPTEYLALETVNDMALRLIRSLNRNVQSCFRTMLSNCSVV